MTVVVTNKLATPSRVEGGKRTIVRDVTFDSSYPEGGEVLSAARLGLTHIDVVESCDIVAVDGTVNVANASYDETNAKLQLFDETPSEVAGEANVEGVVVRIVARGY
jgi:hypothetical protein